MKFPSFFTTAQKAAKLLSYRINNKQIVKEKYRNAKELLMRDFDSELTASGLPRASIEAGHKIIAFRSTILSRLHLVLSTTFNDPISEAKTKFGSDELAKKIAQNNFYIRFTMHPTEGQNLETILGKDAIVKITALMIQAEDNATPTAEMISELDEIAKTYNFKIDQSFANKEGFLAVARTMRQSFIHDFVTKPIHQTTKISIDTEREIILHHLSRCRKEAAEIVAKHDDVVDMDQMRFSSWGCDLDGKPHVKPGHGVFLEYKGQEKFFDDLLLMLDSLGINEDEINAMAAEKRLFLSPENEEKEARILQILEKYDDGSPKFKKIKHYVSSSGCRLAKNMSTTREEVEKTNEAFKDVFATCIANSRESLHALIGKDDFDLLTDATNEEFIATLAKNFDKLKPETKRQIMFLMESAVIHNRHEHIISQFDCNLENYRQALALFEIAKRLPKYHAEIPYFKEYYEQKGKEYDFDLYGQLFSDEAIKAAEESMVELSPLAEDKSTIPHLVEFTEELLADEKILAYIKKAGGILRQTRSNSDGSASLGPQPVSYAYLQADIAIKKLAQEAGLKLEILSGIGANDIERMAPWNLDLLHSQFTAQGGDAQHQTASRMMHMLLKDPTNKSEKALLELQEKYGENEIKKLVDFYHELHLISEEGFDVKVGDRIAKSGHMTSRGTIAGKTVEFLGKLSSRPDSRKGDVASDIVVANDYGVWHDSVYNPQMRRIGAISLQRISGLATFLTAPFYFAPEVDPKLVADFTKIPAIRNTNLSAIFALGTADVESFLLANGFPDDIKSSAVEEYAAKYIDFIDSGYAKSDEFDTPEKIRAGHLSFQICNLRAVLRNAIEPLAYNCSDTTKKELEKIFEEAETNDVIREYDKLVIRACNFLVQDKDLDFETKQTLTCIAQQIHNVKRDGNYYDTRKSLIRQAHTASTEGDIAGFNKACDNLAIITRSAGNPVSPGRKTHELIDYYHDNFDKLAVDFSHDLEDTTYRASAAR